MDRVQDLSFWGFVAASRGTSIIEIRLEQAKNKYAQVMLNYTHATAMRVNLTHNSIMWQGQVFGEVSPGWRRFFLQVPPQRKDTSNLTLTDDHGTTWLGGFLVTFAAEWLRVVVPHFNTSCHSLTPTWHIENGSVKEVVLPPLLNPLQFTVIGARLLSLMLTQAETDIIVIRETMDTLDVQIPPVPLVLRLTLDHTQTAKLPHLVTEGVLGVVEVVTGRPIASLRFTCSLCDDDVHVVQQLHLSTQSKENIVSTETNRQSSPLPCTTYDHAVPTSPLRLIAVGLPVLLGATVGLLLAGVALCVCTARRIRMMTREVTAAMAATAGQTTVAVPYQESSSKDEPQYLEPLPVSVAWQPASSVPSPYHGPKHIHDEVVKFTTIKPTRTPKNSLSSEDDYDYLPSFSLNHQR